MLPGEMERLAADIFKRFNVAWNPNDAFCKYFLSEWKKGRFIGAPLENQHPSEARPIKYYLQAFASAYLWTEVGVWTVKEGHPPL